MVRRFSRQLCGVVNRLKYNTLEAKELRSGNYFQLDLDKSIHELAYIGQGTELLFWCKEKDGKVKGYIKQSDAKPIPLTEEWLIKFGFTISEDGDSAWKSTNEFPNSTTYYQDEQFVINKSFDEIKEGESISFIDFWCLTIGDYRVELYSKIYYVHQLQNAYYLTGKELEIKI